MPRIIEIALIVVTVASIAAVALRRLRDPWRESEGPRRSAAGTARRRADARWVVDDHGTNDHGQAVMKIVLLDDDAVSHGVREIGTYDPADHVAWAVLQGEATALTRDLNERLDDKQEQDRRRRRGSWLD